MNLLNETLSILKDHAKKEADIKWCGNKEYFFPWSKFKQLADIEYDAGFGAPKVAEDLFIVGEDFWLERHEYDGSEWWEFKTIPTKPLNKLNVKALTIEQAKQNGLDVSCGWESLTNLNIKKGGC